MDKKTSIISKQIARFRGWVQAAATLLTNIHLPNFFKGKIYQGNGKPHINRPKITPSKMINPVM